MACSPRFVWALFLVVEFSHLILVAIITLLASISFLVYDRYFGPSDLFDRAFHVSVAASGVILLMLLVLVAILWRWATCHKHGLCLMLLLKNGLIMLWASVATGHAIARLLQPAKKTLQSYYVSDILF